MQSDFPPFIWLCLCLVELCSLFYTTSHSKFIALIFSGALGSSSSNLEQARGYTSSPLAVLRPNMSPTGSRTLHTSRPLSSPVANRPLSPHLPLKKPQFSATFSISHRIFGVALGVAIISVPLATKFSLMCGVWEWTAALARNVVSHSCDCFIVWVIFKLDCGFGWNNTFVMLANFANK